jgi:hypothetical protein
MRLTIKEDLGRGLSTLNRHQEIIKDDGAKKGAAGPVPESRDPGLAGTGFRGILEIGRRWPAKLTLAETAPEAPAGLPWVSSVPSSSSLT